jgi:hypothetical protein
MNLGSLRSIGMRAVQWGVAHPTATQSIIGGVAGYVGSGSPLGALGGAIAGPLAGRALASGGIGAYEPRQGSKFYRKAVGKLSNVVRARMPQASLQAGADVGGLAPGALGPMNPRFAGHARNIGSKRLAAKAIGWGALGGAGIAAGAATSWAVGSARRIGSSYGTGRTSPYGSTFSGMGNGTAGYGY